MNRPAPRLAARANGTMTPPPAQMTPVNHYPLWKNLLILLSIALSVVYALPNLYKPDPAVQVSGASGDRKIGSADLDRVTGALDAAHIEHFGDELQKNGLLVRLKSNEKQLAAKAVLEASLGDDYVVAVNLAPTTPEWLLAIGAHPMKLGLDLSGGVHFLLEVDTGSVIDTRFTTYVDEIQKALHDASAQDSQLAPANWTVTQEKRVITAKFTSSEARDAANDIFKKEFSGLQRQYMPGSLDIQLTLSDAATREIEDYAVSQNLTSLRNRVNELGVSEPLVQRQGRNRIVVELPGVQDTAQAKRIIGKTANLEFRLEAPEDALLSRKEQYSFRNEPQRKAWLDSRVIVTGDRVTDARSSFDTQTSLPQVNITLDSSGGELMNRATRNNIGHRMGVLFIESKTESKAITNDKGEPEVVHTRKVEKNLINLATIQSALGVQFRITGLSSDNEASELALLLRAGALAAPIDFVEERTVGPSAGAENIRQGVMSAEVGLGLVAIFMLFYYRFFGITAVLAVTVNVMMVIACLSILGATLTLPGIAGVILMAGIAVDANVLINSRIKEELKHGASVQLAISQGYSLAFTSIWDSHVTNLLVGIILYGIATGPVQGFAITLSIGIVVSLYTAIMLTRAMVNLWYGRRNVKSLSI
jgi:preprotein translocase subunit SecD